MKKIAIVALCLVAVACQAVTPVKDLLLQGDANGNAQSITNLSDVVLTNGLRLSTATGGSGSTGTLYRVYSTGLVSVANDYGPAALVSVDVDGIRSGLATGTPLYVESGTGTLISASLDPYMTGALSSNAFIGPIALSTLSNSVAAVSGSLTGKADLVGAVFHGPVTAQSFHITSGPAITALGTTNVLIGGVRAMLEGEASGGGTDTGAVRKVGDVMTGALTVPGMTNTGDYIGGGNIIQLSGSGTNSISSGVTKSIISVLNNGSLTIDGTQYGLSVVGYNAGAPIVVSNGSHGFQFSGALSSLASLSVGANSIGSSCRGFLGGPIVFGSSSIGSSISVYGDAAININGADGAMVAGRLDDGRVYVSGGGSGVFGMLADADSSVTNTGVGSFWFGIADSGNDALVSADGSLGVGIVQVTNNDSVAASGMLIGYSGLKAGQHGAPIADLGGTNVTIGGTRPLLFGEPIDATTLNGQTITGVFTSSVVIASGTGIGASQAVGGGIVTNTIAIDPLVVPQLGAVNDFRTSTQGWVRIAQSDSAAGYPRLIGVEVSLTNASPNGSTLGYKLSASAGTTPGNTVRDVGGLYASQRVGTGQLLSLSTAGGQNADNGVIVSSNLVAQTHEHISLLLGSGAGPSGLAFLSIGGVENAANNAQQFVYSIARFNFGSSTGGPSALTSFNDQLVDRDFQIFTDTNESFFVEGDTGRVGIGGPSDSTLPKPQELFHVTNGNVRVDGNLILGSSGAIPTNWPPVQTNKATMVLVDQGATNKAAWISDPDSGSWTKLTSHNDDGDFVLTDIDEDGISREYNITKLFAAIEQAGNVAQVKQAFKDHGKSKRVGMTKAEKKAIRDAQVAAWQARKTAWQDARQAEIAALKAFRDLPKDDRRLIAAKGQRPPEPREPFSEEKP